MSMPKFEMGSVMTKRERSTSWAINHWQGIDIFQKISTHDSVTFRLKMRSNFNVWGQNKLIKYEQTMQIM
jgi:hypothetical protein